MDDYELLRELLDRASKDPAYAIASIGEAKALAARLSLVPYSSSRMYLPGTFLPATNIIEVTGIPLVVKGTTSVAVEINIKTPGVVVGLLGASLPNNDDASRASLSYQLTMEDMKAFATDGASITNAFASFAGFAPNAPWTPVMLPARGSGGWSVTFRNASTTTDMTPVFNLAFLQGEEALRRCAPRRV